tara:strand:- start:361 stop:579 length:219 start_codon:yes stop_codon:yes gene_type:complete
MSNYYEGGKTGSGVTKLLGDERPANYSEKRMSEYNKNLIRKHKERLLEAEARRHMFSLFALNVPVDCPLLRE